MPLRRDRCPRDGFQVEDTRQPASTKYERYGFLVAGFVFLLVAGGTSVSIWQTYEIDHAVEETDGTITSNQILNTTCEDHVQRICYSVEISYSFEDIDNHPYTGKETVEFETEKQEAVNYYDHFKQSRTGKIYYLRSDPTKSSTNPHYEHSYPGSGFIILGLLGSVFGGIGTIFSLFWFCYTIQTACKVRNRSSF